jgi:hypothetical protein
LIAVIIFIFASIIFADAIADCRFFRRHADAIIDFRDISSPPFRFRLRCHYFQPFSPISFSFIFDY